MKRIAWESALRDLEERYRQSQTPELRRCWTNACSLAALYIPNFSSAAWQMKEAIALEPLNPLHRYRLALLYMRFGQWHDAQHILQKLGEQLVNLAWPQYVRALAFLRTGETKRASNIAAEIALINRNFVWAQFLTAEAQLRQTSKRPEKYLSGLPKGEAYDAIWADLLIKFVVADPVKGPKFVENYLKTAKVLPKGSREEALVQQAVSWNTASAEELREHLARLAPGSKTEQLALLFFCDHLKKSTDAQTYLTELKRLYDLFPHRSAVRRLYTAALNRYTVDEAAAGRYRSAMVAVEICLRLEPYNTIHYQNRATLFTLLRERAPYHRAWEELDRNQYRLALLGHLDREIAQAMAKRHRMFAQQARLSPRASEHLGIFRADQRRRDALVETILRVNQAQLDADPELLRQWVHHRKAELVFSHLALGTEPDRFLLGYSDDFTAKARLEGLIALSGSLAVLAGEEGSLLAARIEHMWRDMVTRAGPSYSVDQEDTEIEFLKQSHIETLGDMALLCYNWEPNERDVAIVEELIEFLTAEAAFLDWETLLAALKQQEGTDGIALLNQVVASSLDSKSKKSELSHSEQLKVINRMVAHLLINLSLDIYKESNARPKEAAQRALRVLERAREAAPDDPAIEYFAARFFFIGDFYEESRQAISRFYRINKDQTSPYTSEIEVILKALDDVNKENERKYLIGEANEQDPTNTSSLDARIRELRTILDRFPSSIQTYEDLAHLLAADGAFDAALDWAERAIAHCLSRRGQMKARMLNLELLGMRLLGQAHLNEIKIYFTGVYSPLKNALELICEEKPDLYPLHYLLGMCWLAEGESERAQAAFKKALECCDRQLHFIVLHPLASDVEQALYDTAKQSIDQAIKEQRYKDAFEHAARTMKNLKRPEACLMDLASIQLAAFVAHIQLNLGLPQIPQITVGASWNEKLAAAIGDSDGLGRARRLVQLAMEQHPPSKRRGEELLLQIDQLQTQLNLASVLSQSGKLSRDGKLEEALDLVSSVGAAANTEPRVLHQRAMLLLKLERFSEADDVVSALKTIEDPLAVDFVEKYPSLKFRQQLRAVQALLRKGMSEAARERLNTIAVSSDEAKLEIAYCRAFAAAIDGYRCIASGKRGQALPFFQDALDEIEPRVAAAKQNNHVPLLELYDKLTKDLNDLSERMYE